MVMRWFVRKALLLAYISYKYKF